MYGQVLITRKLLPVPWRLFRLQRLVSTRYDSRRFWPWADPLTLLAFVFESLKVMRRPFCLILIIILLSATAYPHLRGPFS